MSENRILTEKDVIFAMEKAQEFNPNADFVIIGTGAIGALVKDEKDKLGFFSRTEDVDICIAKHSEELLEKAGIGIDDSELDKGSEFQKDNQFYVQIIGSHLYSHLPEGWSERAKTFELDGGHFAKALSPIDVAFNKLKASRGKDIETVGEMITQGVISREEMSDVYKSVKTDQPILFARVERGIEAVEINLQKDQPGHDQRVEGYLEKVKSTPLGNSNLRGVLGIDFGRLDDEHKQKLLNLEKDFIADRIGAKEFTRATDEMTKPTDQMAWNNTASKLAEIASTAKVYQATRVNNLVNGAIRDQFITVGQGQTACEIVKDGIGKTTHKDALDRLTPLYKAASKKNHV